jgi:flagellar biosynthetic protein FliR
VAMMVFINVSLGIISRVAPQLSLFSVGFPITIGVGLVGLVFTLPAMNMPFMMAMERLLTTLR